MRVSNAGKRIQGKKDEWTLSSIYNEFHFIQIYNEDLRITAIVLNITNQKKERNDCVRLPGNNTALQHEHFLIVNMFFPAIYCVNARYLSKGFARIIFLKLPDFLFLRVHKAQGD